jgi:hypothetical protein
MLKWGTLHSFRIQQIQAFQPGISSLLLINLLSFYNAVHVFYPPPVTSHEEDGRRYIMFD